MKYLSKLTYACLAALTVTITACSDDKDEPETSGKPSDQESVTKPNPSSVFTEGLPTQVGDYVIYKNDNGLVTKIVNDDEVTTFNYSPSTESRSATRPSDYDMTMNVEWGNDDVNFYIKLNAQGFIEYAYEEDEDDDDYTDIDEWWFKYNDNGQLIEMKRTEGDNEITTITYNADGDITKVKVCDDDYPSGKMECEIKYTDASYADVIYNKSGIMLYDASFRIDMDEMAPAYYAGLLGKATAHLPLSASEVSYQEYFNDYSFVWVLNDNEMPVKFICTYKSYYPWNDEPYEGVDDPVNFKW
ncbi:MAG: DUF4595 domain-containing protein [Bacteroidales bacterium]|nr:DUF4595 domain-containing protein [Bacteroidales bacterium]